MDFDEALEAERAQRTAAQRDKDEAALAFRLALERFRPAIREAADFFRRANFPETKISTAAPNAIFPKSRRGYVFSPYDFAIVDEELWNVMSDFGGYRKIPMSWSRFVVGDDGDLDFVLGEYDGGSQIDARTWLARAVAKAVAEHEAR